MKKTIISSILFLIIGLAVNAQTTLVGWNFNFSGSSTSGIPANSGTIIGTTGTSSAPFFSSVGCPTSGEAICNGWSVGDTWVSSSFTTTGFSSVTYSYLQHSFANGPNNFTFQYSLNGSVWTTVVGPYGVSTNGDCASWYTATDLAFPAAVDNQATVYVRWLCNNSTGAGGGRLDEVVIKGSAACTNPDVPTIAATPLTICPGSSSTLNITGSLNDATNWHIYTGSCGGTQIGTTASSTFVVSPAVTTTYYIRGEDGAGCVDESTGSCGSVTVTVGDAVNPTITCPGNQNQTVNASCLIVLADYTGLAMASDNCTPSPTVTQVPAPGTIITGASVVVELTADDGNGNTSFCTFDVFLNDATAPTAVCQNITIFLDGAGSASITAADIDGGSTDNCSGLTLSASQTAFTCANLGPNNVTLTAVDGNMNSSNCIAVVTVLDTVSPVVTCPGNQTEVASAICDFVLPDYTGLGMVSDNCSVPTITQSPIAGTTITANTTVTFTANDGSGNTSTCTFDVVLDLSACVGAECSNAIALAPMNVCGDTQNVTGSTVGGTPLTEAFCGTSAGTGGASWYTFTGDGGDWTASTVNAGTNYDTKIWIFEGLCGALNCVTGNDDFSGVQSQVTFPTTAGLTYYVIVGGFSSSEGNYDMTISNVETEAPVADITPLPDVMGVCEVTSLTAPPATDNCSAVTVTNDATLPITSNTTITWTYTDASGNFSTQTQNVVLTDLVLPTASNPATMNVECIGDAIVDINVVTDAADNCSITTVAFVSDVSDGLTCPETITRTYSVTDGSGNSIDVTQTIVVQDITAPTASNPLTLNVQCAGDVPAPVTGWVSDEADNCSTPTVAWVSDLSDGLSCPETITRTFSVTDDCGNTMNVEQLIVVLDIEAPTADIAALPSLTGNCDVTPATATANDNCDGTVNGIPDMAFPITAAGTTTVTWTYTDACGNVSAQTQDVTITPINVNTHMANDGITFVADNLGQTYQWIDCDSNMGITGATNYNFTPTYGSNFAVIITENGCSDTSACVNSVVGIGELSSENVILYPNPTNGVFKITVNTKIEAIDVIDMLGRLITLPTNIETGEVDGSELETGKYIVRVVTANNVLTKEIVVIK